MKSIQIQLLDGTFVVPHGGHVKFAMTLGRLFPTWFTDTIFDLIRAGF